MIHRILNPSKTQSFFLFGARGTGKSTFVETHYTKNIHVINLLEDRWLARYLATPDRLINDLSTLSQAPEWIVIDEVQKAPKLLDTVHHLIEKKKYKFILTGSSARKLKRGAANLLAGRAFNYHMFPLTSVELQKDFDLGFVLQWGSLPKIFSLGESDREEFLRSYTQTYLKEEILQEQLVRNGVAFRQFLEVAAQENGKLLNFRKLGRDIDVDTKTIQSYFQILEDTLVGFFLPAFHRSPRKSIGKQPKFYLFDLGIKKALESSLTQPVLPRTSAYGQAFEHFVVCESLRLNSYFRRDYSLYHYHLSTGGELDLVLARGRKVIAIEIKSTEKIDEVEVRRVGKVARALNPSAIFFVSNDPVPTTIDGVQCRPWQHFLKDIFVDEKI